MAFRIYTRTGDKGETGLFGGKRISKDDIRIEAYGTVDELNAHMGVVGDRLDDQDLVAFLRSIQSDLFTLGSHLAKDPEKDLPLPPLPGTRISEMETMMDAWDEVLPPLTNFILPGGHPTVSAIHLARCVCRRAERRVITLDHAEGVDQEVIKYLNRLSDFLFMLGREISRREGADEIIWKP